MRYIPFHNSWRPGFLNELVVGECLIPEGPEVQFHVANKPIMDKAFGKGG